MPSDLRRLLRNLLPGERIGLALLGLVVLAILVRWPWVPGLARAVSLHLVIVLTFLGFVALAQRYRGRSFWRVVRPLGAVGVMFALYFTLATVPFELFPWRADPWLDGLDRSLFLGTSPTVWLDGRLSSLQIEALSFAYLFFIPYLYFSVIVGLLGRPEKERDELFAALVVLYSLSFMGYLFAPARGPVVALEGLVAPLPGGRFLDQVVGMVARAGGPHGALPSLHLGVTLLVCRFDLRTNTLRGLIYVPLVVGIALATVALRYHWVVDLLVGAAMAWIALRVAPQLVGKTVEADPG
ncbi:MAG: phosphatase PAP2 family protein [Acidobacteria bacterium]|nr:phosphatase PAP2 family protein [Acidobacteriota bacterium]